MKPLPIISIALLAVILSSCNKDPDLGDFQSMENSIDMSQTNRYNEALLCRSWVVTACSQERYEDGSLQSTTDVKSGIGNKFTLRSDHLIYADGKSTGNWLYSHNYLLTKYGKGYYAEEVAMDGADVLYLKSENTPEGGPFSYYFQDRSGTHVFTVRELHPQN